MIYEIKNYSYTINHNINCGISAIIYSLLTEGISVSETDVAFFSNYVSFGFWPVMESNGTNKTYLSPISLDFFDQFSKRTNLGLKHYNIQDDEEDFNIIVDAIKNNHCVNVLCDQYYIGCAISEAVRRFFSPDENRMPCHYITIHGVDTENRKVLFTEPIFNMESPDHWITYEELNKARSVEWRNLSVNRDLFIFDDVSNFSPLDNKTVLRDQLELLINKIPDSLAQINSFLEKYVSADAPQEYIDELINDLHLCLCCFDLSKNFYRRYLYKFILRYFGNCEITMKYKSLYKSWHKVAQLSDKVFESTNKAYGDYIKIIDLIIENAENELRLNRSALSLL